jgi:hypothetical protein
VVPRQWLGCRQHDLGDREDAVQAVNGEVDPLFEPSTGPARIYRAPEYDGDQEGEGGHGGVVHAVQQLQWLGPGVMQPCLLSERVHKRMYAGYEEIEA